VNFTPEIYITKYWWCNHDIMENAAFGRTWHTMKLLLHEKNGTVVKK